MFCRTETHVEFFIWKCCGKTRLSLEHISLPYNRIITMSNSRDIQVSTRYSCNLMYPQGSPEYRIAMRNHTHPQEVLPSPSTVNHCKISEHSETISNTSIGNLRHPSECIPQLHEFEIIQHSRHPQQKILSNSQLERRLLFEGYMDHACLKKFKVAFQRICKVWFGRGSHKKLLVDFGAFYGLFGWLANPPHLHGR